MATLSSAEFRNQHRVVKELKCCCFCSRASLWVRCSGSRCTINPAAKRGVGLLVLPRNGGRTCAPCLVAEARLQVDMSFVEQPGKLRAEEFEVRSSWRS